MSDLLTTYHDTASTNETAISTQDNTNAKTRSIDFQLTLAPAPRIGWPYQRLDRYDMPDKDTIVLTFMDAVVTIHGHNLVPLYERILRQVQPTVRVNDEHQDSGDCFVTEVAVKNREN